MHMHSTKISGLAVDTEYSFHLVLRTTAGTYASKQVVVRTHKMTDLSGITITTGILPPQTREELAKAVERIGAKIVDGVRIDTTHFVTTEGRGVAWEKAVEMNIPVVRPEWVEACEKTGRILGVTKFYLDAVRPPVPGSDETQRTVTSPTPAPAQQSQKDLPQTPAQSEEVKETEAQKDDEKDEDKDEDESSEDDDDEEEPGDEEKAKATDEQKVRLEDKDTQKVALRPGGQSFEQEKAAEEEDEKDNSDDKAPEPSPGDGASFQDVAL
ncbi:BRCT domain-containing protein [Hypoxylon sp. FL0890]|nr:BRCT domain-containing protein [Hypoxylon sp. FL0890]